MSNSELHLFVPEGYGAEPLYLEKLEQNFFGRRISLKCVYDAELYQLYEHLKKEVFAVDIVNVLKERNQRNAEILKDYNRDSFAGVYLFFDYDAHSTLADDDKVNEMLEYFDNETENGCMYLSYFFFCLPNASLLTRNEYDDRRASPRTVSALERACAVSGQFPST